MENREGVEKMDSLRLPEKDKAKEGVLAPSPLLVPPPRVLPLGVEDRLPPRGGVEGLPVRVDVAHIV